MTQTGSWWLTSTASCPRASSRAAATAASIRSTCSVYGSPQDGRNGLRRYGQCSGWRSEPSPTPKVLPSKWLPASMSRSSVRISTSNAAAIGPAVSCARWSGEAMTATTSRRAGTGPARCAATMSAIALPRSESR